MSWGSLVDNVELPCSFLRVSCYLRGLQSVTSFNIVIGAVLIIFNSAIGLEFDKFVDRHHYAITTAAVLMLRFPATAAQHGGLLLTVLAVSWLFYRAWQTISIPVPHLITILRIDFPETPELVLYDIRPDAASLYWSRPTSRRSVTRFRVQVNGVIVGETPGSESAITVSGLRPNHYYNVCVIAVGPTNFHAASRVMRMRTSGENDRPAFGHGRIPERVALRKQAAAQTDEAGDEPTPASDKNDDDNHHDNQPPPLSIPHRILQWLLRRKSTNRSHSSSVTSLDQPPSPRDPASSHHDGDNGDAHGAEPDPDSDPESSYLAYYKLNAQFRVLQEGRNEISAALVAEEFRFQKEEDALKQERERKRLELQDKERRSRELRVRVRQSRDDMRNATKATEQAKKRLEASLLARRKVEKMIADFKTDTTSLRNKTDMAASQLRTLERDKEASLARLDREIAALQRECAKLDTELTEKGKHLTALKADSKKSRLPADSDDGRPREQDPGLSREWDQKKKDLTKSINAEVRKAKDLDQQLKSLQSIQTALQEAVAISAAAAAAAVPPPPPAPSAHPPLPAPLSFPSIPVYTNFSSVDLETVSAHSKRRSRATSSLSGSGIAPITLPQAPPAASPSSESGFAAPPGLPARFPVIPGGHHHQLANPADTDEVSTAARDAWLGAHPAVAAPLSPSARGLLPSGIWDDDVSDARASDRYISMMAPPPQHGVPVAVPPLDLGPHSPSSSTRSLNTMAPSPHGSVSSLGIRQSASYGEVMPPPPPTSMPAPPPGLPATASRMAALLSLQRGKNAQTADDFMTGPGSLRPSISRSFPRENEEDFTGHRHRASHSAHHFTRSSTGPEPSQVSAHNRALSARRLNLFGSAGGTGAGGTFAPFDREPSSPRPSSLSSDMTHLTSDSTTIPSPWGAIPPQADPQRPTNIWSSTGAFRDVPSPWTISGAQSRRRSSQNLSAGLKTSLASDDDEIIPTEALLDPHVSPSQVGVIGSRPPGRARGPLNPAAPIQIGGLSKRTDKEGDSDPAPCRTREGEAEGEGGGGKSGGGGQSSPGTAADPAAGTAAAAAAAAAAAQTASIDRGTSPIGSRNSNSNTPWGLATATTRDQRDNNNDNNDNNNNMNSNSNSHSNMNNNNHSSNSNVVRMLFRKANSSKFGNLSSRRKESGLFKKGGSVGSVAGSERQLSQQLLQEPAGAAPAARSITTSSSRGKLSAP